MTRLTPAEEQVMLRLWKLEKASVKEIVDLYQDLKQVPAYNTTSTIIRILEKKKFVKHKAKGRGYIYFPRISKENYRLFLTENLLNNYFNGDKSLLIDQLNKI
jgi:BlaI family penicillinase repressor